MSILEVKLPDSIRQRVEHFANEEGVSVDDYLAAVITQRVAVAEADSYVRRRGARGSARRMLETLRSAPDVDPEPYDRIPKDGEEEAGDAGKAV